jgi:hypothetical protein
MSNPAFVLVKKQEIFPVSINRLLRPAFSAAQCARSGKII